MSCGNAGGGSKSESAGGGGSAAPFQSQRLESLGTTFGGLKQLTSDSSRADIVEALERMPNNTQFFEYNMRDGVVEGYNEIIKDRNGNFTISSNGGYTRAIEPRELAKKWKGMSTAGWQNAFHADAPNTASAVQVTGRKVYEHGGMQFRNGTYDKLVDKRQQAGGPRKVADKGLITTYEGQQFAVTKRGGEYFVTHVGSGMAAGAVKSMQEATQRIRMTAERIKTGISGRDLSKMEERLAKALRGD